MLSNGKVVSTVNVAWDTPSAASVTWARNSYIVASLTPLELQERLTANSSFIRLLATDSIPITWMLDGKIIYESQTSGYSEYIQVFCRTKCTLLVTRSGGSQSSADLSLQGFAAYTFSDTTESCRDMFINYTGSASIESTSWVAENVSVIPGTPTYGSASSGWNDNDSCSVE
jgi:hypothetical protein